jgi:hypothetical protein
MDISYIVAEILRLRCASLRMTNGRFKEVFRSRMHHALPREITLQYLMG